MPDQTTAETVAWPPWLESLTPEQRVQEILTAVAKCYTSNHAGCGVEGAVALHCTLTMAEQFLLRLLAEARRQASDGAEPSADGIAGSGTGEPVRGEAMTLLAAAADLLSAAAGMAGEYLSGPWAVGVREWHGQREALVREHAATLEGRSMCPERHPDSGRPCAWLADHGTVHRDGLLTEWETPGPAPTPPGRLANVEVKGFRDLGVVAITETNLAGVPMLHAECRDGSAADFPASSVHFIAYLPDGSPWPEPGTKPRLALTSGSRYEDDHDWRERDGEPF